MKIAVSFEPGHGQWEASIENLDFSDVPNPPAGIGGVRGLGKTKYSAMKDLEDNMTKLLDNTEVIIWFSLPGNID